MTRHVPLLRSIRDPKVLLELVRIDPDRIFDVRGVQLSAALYIVRNCNFLLADAAELNAEDHEFSAVRTTSAPGRRGKSALFLPHQPPNKEQFQQKNQKAKQLFKALCFYCTCVRRALPRFR